ncbi:MAG: PQQ-binding-like beta-propeller repeat protein [Spirochaetaceae bacterium]|nr:MAG: PQQ-binding-like beta-propeller repeat protein [Spirochaetaceae bacterium]
MDGRNVYGLNKNGVLYCLKKGTGGLRWKRDLVSEYGAVQPYYGFAGSPVVVGDLLVLTANTSGMALNKKTGQLLWASEKPPEEFPTFGLTNTTGTDYCTPVVSADEDEHYALLSSWKGLSSVDIETGKLLWLYEWALATDGMTADPLIFGHKFYIAHGVSNLRQLVGFLLAVESGKPNVRWENAHLWSTISTPIYWEGHIYGCHNLPDNDNPDRGSLRCLNAETGELCWEQDLGQGFSLSAAAGKLIILTTRGKLHIAEATPSSYQEISSSDVLGGKRKPVKFWTPPVLCRGKLYCRDYGGDLICVDVRQRDVVARQ